MCVCVDIGLIKKAVKLECFEFVNVLQQVDLFYNNVEITGSRSVTMSLISIVRTRLLNPDQAAMSNLGQVHYVLIATVLTK